MNHMLFPMKRIVRIKMFFLCAFKTNPKNQFCSFLQCALFLERLLIANYVKYAKQTARLASLQWKMEKSILMIGALNVEAVMKLFMGA